MLTEKQKRLVEENLGLAVDRATKFWNKRQKTLERKGMTYEDVRQLAYEALCKAAMRYDETKAKFSTFAVTTIDFEIHRRAIRDNHFIKKTRYERLKEKIKDKEELQKILVLDEYISLDERNTDEYGDHCHSNYNYIESIDRNFEYVELYDIIDRQLSEREKAILVMYYFEDMSQYSIAKITNISQVHISRILRKSLKKLREVM
ncbi:MAG: sigma-70 family RNA polymerase sigma factor [Thermosipho sp. (in: Bacteria)]|nr:sigma-70 family RNA polymerase sigma factor [Thermosipho sp. (in: thermotogales)]